MVGYTNILVQGVTLLLFIHSGQFRYPHEDVIGSDIICYTSYTILKMARYISIAKLTPHKTQSELPKFIHF